MSTKFLLTSALALSTTAVMGLSNIDEAEAAKKGKEKCYGVVKAGKNDCGSSDGSHSCAGQATKDSEATEWVYLPEGVCDKLAGGVKG